jgi:dynein assembly factor 3, axonemal
MWGFSPATDLLENMTSTSPVRVLVSRPSDIRHLLVTISRRRRHKMPPIHFVVIENELEVIARHLLLLQVACDWELPIRQRATVFLELFGNSLVQERTQRYIQRLGEELIELVCDEKGNLGDIVDLSGLKYRERDQLVETFRCWNASVPFDGTPQPHEQYKQLLVITTTSS